MNELDDEKAYLVFGKYDKENQCVIYRMSTAIDVVSLQVGQTPETPVMKRTGT